MEEELAETKQKLIDQFYIDHLCALPNLYKLRSDLELSENFTLIAFNIDNFKVLNDFYGFVVGDFILESVAKKLVSSLENVHIYRIASDEFAILLDKKLNFY